MKLKSIFVWTIYWNALQSTEMNLLEFTLLEIWNWINDVRQFIHNVVSLLFFAIISGYWTTSKCNYLKFGIKVIYQKWKKIHSSADLKILIVITVCLLTLERVNTAHFDQKITNKRLELHRILQKFRNKYVLNREKIKEKIKEKI